MRGTDTASGDPTNVLLVEDNPGDVRLIEELLDEASGRSGASAESDDAEPLEIRHVDHLSDGLQRLDGGGVDVVLLDLGLPDSSGIATLETVLERSSQVPIVVLTGLDDERIGVQAVQQGAQEYLVKDELTPMLLQRSLRHATERKKFDRTRTALHEASRDLIQAESEAEVSRRAIETAVEVLDLQGISIYLFDDTANELQPVASTDYVERILGEVPSFGTDDTAITWRSFITGETTALDDVLESEHVHRRDTPFRSGIWIPLGDHGVMTILSEDAGGFDQQTHQLADHLAATVEAALDRVEREEVLREHERELEQRNRQLEELDRMNGLIREIDQVLVQASTREAIEEAVCERLTEDELFAFAWIGETVADGGLTPRTWAGDDGGYLDEVPLSTDADDAPPAATATETGSVAFTPNVAADLRSAPWRKAALARGLQSVISIPLRYGEVSYGVLTVFATEPDAFDARSKETFEELGETIANAINSVETRRTLLTDTAVELELAIHEPDDVLHRLAREADCSIEYGGIVPQSDDTNRLFFSASGAPADALRESAEGVPSIQQLVRIGEDEGGDGDDGDAERRYEATISGPTIPSTFVECGAVARSIRVTDAVARAVVELPNTTGVRTFIERLEATYPDTELIARRDKERADRSRQAFESALTAELTGRQLETLQTAYHSGYFEWPRDRTGEEVAQSLGITQPTFNGHLRTAERKLCALLFDGGSTSLD